ncbi:AT-rich interactive domain-containing protein 2 isoform X3 [Aethina tumida]|uniref:AT-rich interactive domain-containing protein 2 isoform X3 n=1 Tax=Aethina tumida TaxID=116153 RepID=UPI002147BACE|nr:AT-rich interactive domain-containing protein 2 isoform X3 [Aethina tumida]
MARILDKDPATYCRERDGFLRDLQHFNETKGTPFRRCPNLGGREVDLYLLYTLVTAHGGWIKVNSKNTWSEILPHFKVPSHCVNASVGLKQIYLRYLDRWEKVHYLGEDGERGSDDDEESRHKRWSARALHSVPYTYNYSQHNIAESNREYNHLSTNLYKASDYDRLALSLISPLPNEQDFAINVCTLLSNDGKHTLKLEKHPRIVNFLLGHAGVFNHESLRKVFIHYYTDIRKHSIHSFWKDVLESREYLDLTEESKFVEKKEKTVTEKAPGTNFLSKDTIVSIESERMEVDAPGAAVNDKDCDTDSDCEIVDHPDALKQWPGKMKIEPEDESMFCLKRSLGTQDYVGQRVLQIATILRNLSFIEENMPVLIGNVNFMRFVLLCSSAQWSTLKNLGLDMLGNMATEFLVKDSPNDILSTTLMKIVLRGLESEDRSLCISSLEVLNKLSQNEQNEDALLRILESNVYRRVCSFLTIHDVMLLIYTLECLYSLSSLGEKSCHYIVSNHGVIDTLVSLVTVEGKSYGPKACIGMKLVETVTGVMNVAQQNQQQNQQPATPATSANGANASGTTTTTTWTTSAPASVATPVKMVSPGTPIRTTVQMAPQRLIAVTPATIANSPTPVSIATPIPQQSIALTATTVQTTTTSVLTPQQMIQQQHAHQQAIQENEQFALAWLRATYEPCTNGKVDHQEVYKHYLNSCSKIGRKGVISPLHFPRCVRSVFGGTVGPNPMKPANPNDPQYYDGIKVRPTPLIISIPNTSTMAQSPVKNAPQQSKGVQLANPATVTPQSQQAAAIRNRRATPPSKSPVLSVPTDNVGDAAPLSGSPASPILKAQLSAPPKQQQQREHATAATAPKPDAKSQVMAHPHLSQALLGASGTTTTTSATSGQKDSGQSSTSLIKSLLANKVAARQQQQRMLAQQGTSAASAATTPVADHKAKTGGGQETPKTSRLNGARQLFNDIGSPEAVGDPAVSSTTQFASGVKGKKEPPQPPPPPLAPLSNNNAKLKVKIDNEDSDSIGNNSLSSSTGLGTVGVGGISSTEDGENSLTSFEGLLNGVPNIDTALNEDSNSKDSVHILSNEILINKPLRLADLLEKKFEKSPPMLNGGLSKDLRLGDKTGLDLVENHIEKALRDSDCHIKHEEPKLEDVPTTNSSENKVDDVPMSDAEIKQEDGTNVGDALIETKPKINLKRAASDEIVECDSKKPLLSANVNGSRNPDSPAPDSVSSSNGEEAASTATASTAAAKLFADLAADILEDEDEEQLMQEAAAPTISLPEPTPQQPTPQIVVDNSGGHVQLVTSGTGTPGAVTRQVIVSQGQIQPANQVVFTTSGAAQIKPGTTPTTNAPQTVIVNAGQQRNPVVIQQANPQFLLSSGLQGQVQLVASSQPGQYVLQTSGTQGTYMVAQPQTAVVHGQPQTVLVAQTSQQQGTGAKTIIILQQQPANNTATHHQKVVVTPQGQQVVVTQVPRPVIHQSSVSNNNVAANKAIKTSVVGTTATTVVQTTNSNGITTVVEKKEEIKPKIIRDLTTAFVCEWGQCNVDTKFKSANQVYLHACEAHCPQDGEEVLCQWDRCDSMKRKRFSLMTHLHDKHCNPEAMKQNLIRRKKEAQGVKVDPPPPAPANSHPGYAPDAALHAIKRHALEFVNPKELQTKSAKHATPAVSAVVARPGPSAQQEQDDNEGPVTKSIRLTASLILRNLVIYSTHCRRYLKGYESHLANVALSNVESSRTIAQILYDMNETSNLR